MEPLIPDPTVVEESKEIDQEEEEDKLTFWKLACLPSNNKNWIKTL